MLNIPYNDDDLYAFHDFQLTKFIIKAVFF